MDSQFNKEIAVENVLNVKDFFKGKNVFITGSTGFVGKVLVEKLLKSCPDVGKVYLLMRNKKGQDIDVRLKGLTELPLFDKLRNQNASSLEKLIALHGDMSEPCLGLKDMDRQKLAEVHVVFHMAASVRFDDPPHLAILKNLRSTSELLELALDMRDIKAFVYISTAYSNCYLDEVEERVYNCKGYDWRDALRWAETSDPTLLAILKHKIIGDHPNTYTFSKFLSESAVNDYRDRLPVCIYRPSIVTLTVRDPIPGWLDTLNGPAALALGMVSGVVRVLLNDPKVTGDFMPCDVIVSGLIIATAYRGTTETDECVVINAANNGKVCHPPAYYLRAVDYLMMSNPPRRVLWYPHMTVTNSKWLYHVMVLLLHVLPGLCVDLGLKIKGVNFRLMRVYRKLYVANNDMYFFGRRDWKFHTDKFDALPALLNDEERETFDIDITKYDALKVIKDGHDGILKYYLKEADDVEKKKKAIAYVKRLYYLDRGLKAFFFCGLLLCLISKLAAVTWKI